ncbi:hypothetical protein [Ideonella paludis]|uniref:hypothetical protein n=1 Tax=Ideonella paludis TaxID=1233411 RepID=UPI00363231D9
MSTTFGTQETPRHRRPVAWYSPPVLWQAGRELLQSASFQRNLDRRETFSPVLQPLDFSQRSASREEPFWFDFLSDTGDGGNASFTVAQALLKRELEVSTGAGHEDRLTLPEGELLVLGVTWLTPPPALRSTNTASSSPLHWPETHRAALSAMTRRPPQQPKVPTNSSQEFRRTTTGLTPPPHFVVTL